MSSTYDVTRSSRRSGSCRRACDAASSPISTSCLGEYLLSGGVMGVCADTSAIYSVVTTMVAEMREFIWLCFCKNRPGKELRKMAESTTRKQLIDKLNEDLSREYQAIIAYVVYSQVLKGAEYMTIAKELEQHASQELQHALKISKHIDYLGGMPTTMPKPVKVSEKPSEMLRADLDNENETVRNYRERVRQCEALSEFAIAEDLREIIRQEQEH